MLFRVYLYLPVKFQEYSYACQANPMTKANIKIIFQRVATLLLAIFLTSCDRPDKPQIGGYLYFTSGSYIGQFSLGSGKTSILGSVGDGKAVQLSKYLENKLLLTVNRHVNRQSVWQVEEFDIRRGYSSTLFPGRMVQYLPISQKIVYDDGSELVATQIYPGKRERSTIYKRRSRVPGIVVALTDDQLLFSFDEETGRQIYRFEGKDNRLTPMDGLSAACSLDGAVWVPDAGGEGRLACKLRRDFGVSGEYYLVSLDGIVDRQLSLPGDRKFRAIAYLHDRKTLLLMENQHNVFDGQEKMAVWIHDINTEVNNRIIKSDYFGSHIIYQGLYER